MMFNLSLLSFSIITGFFLFNGHATVDEIEHYQEFLVAIVDTSIDVKALIPAEYELHQSFFYDIDKDSQVELLIHCTSNKKVECQWLEKKNCYLDELLIFEHEDDWSLLKTFPIYQPIEFDSNAVRLSLDSQGVLILKNHLMPTCCSGVTQQQYFSYRDSSFMMDSLYHSAGTRVSGGEYYSWEYLFDFDKKELRFESSYLDLRYEESEPMDADTTMQFIIKERPNLFNRIELEELVPEGIELPWY